MGTAVSRQEDLSENDYLKQFSSAEHIPPSHPFWNNLLSYNIQAPVSNQEQLSLDSRVEPLCQQLIVNNLKSGNIGSLVRVFIERSNELLVNVQSKNQIFVWQLYNTLFLIRCIIKYIVETLSEEQLIAHFEVEPIENEKPQIDPVGRLELFLDSLIEIIVEVPLTDLTYPIHLETINCLMILLSVQTYGNQRTCATERLVFIAKFILGRQSVKAASLMEKLVGFFIQQKIAPVNPFGNESGGSIVMGIASGILSILAFGGGGKEASNGEKNNVLRPDTPLSNQALLLILILTNHCTTSINLYRQSLFSCLNTHDGITVSPSQTLTSFKVDFEQLYCTLCDVVDSDAPTLLLYALLHRNFHFKKYVLQRNDIENLILPILRTLYNAPDSNSHHIYMSLIILLILSEDEIFNKKIHEVKLKNILWYTERAISEISLGGLLILVVIRTIQYNILKMRDKYLHTNCLATLANMSAQFRYIHSYVAQRLVSLFEILSKKQKRLEERVKASTEIADSDAKLAVKNDDDKQIHDLAVLEDVLKMIVEILNSALSNQLFNNPNLVYTLLYKKDIFEPYAKRADFQGNLYNINLIVTFFTRRLDELSQNHDLDESEVLATITRGAQTFSKTQLRKLTDLKFKYVEEDKPEEFFIPYVWNLVARTSYVKLNSETDKLFNSTSETNETQFKEVVC